MSNCPNLPANAQSELIPIRNNDGAQAVLGRDLHAFLKVNERYTQWFDRMTGYGFVEGHDFIRENGKSTGGRPSANHIISLDMAKEICMIQRSPLGRQARQYFIECEKRARNNVPALSGPELVARALIEAQNMLEEKDHQIKELAPKALFADAVAASEGSMLIREFAKELCQNGYETGERRLYEWFRNNGYLISANSSDRNRPTQYSVERGWFEVTEHVVQAAGRDPFVSPVTRITGKGRQYFMKKLLGGVDDAA